MSYILDALRKSEEERAQAQSAPADLLADDTALIDQKVQAGDQFVPAEGTNNIYLFVLFSLSVLIAVVVLFFVFSPEDKNTEEQSVALVDDIVEVTVAPVVPVSVSERADPGEAQGNNDSGDVTAIVMEPPEHVVPIEGISGRQRDLVGAIEVSSHIFSTDASRRSIVVNGARYTEGDVLFADVVIHEITPQGMVLKIGSSLYSVSRGRGWNP